MTDGGEVTQRERRGASRRATALRHLVRTPAGVIGSGLTLALVLIALFAEGIAPSDPFAGTGPPLQPPSAEHLMGTDNFGRDVFSGVVLGLRTSMTLALGVIAISLIIGLLVGMVSGYRGGLVDDLLMRITEVFQAIPLFFLALLVVGFFGAGLDHLILLLGFTSWELLARLVRSETLSLRNREFVEAARASGASNRRILVSHILPHVLPGAVVVTSLVGSRAILIEAALSFIGFGDPNTISLGYLVFNAQAFLQVAWWMSVFPGAAIAVAVLGLNLLGDVLNDAFDPTSAASKSRFRRGRLAPAPQY
jgi:peptide/nickel transport system permease protein